MDYDYVAQFARKLIDEAGLTILEPAYLEDYQRKLEEQIVRRIGIVALENMNDQTLEEYNQIIQASKGEIEQIDQDKIIKLYEKNIPDFSEIVKKEMTEFADVFLKNFKKK